ncbi:hypothetical protein ABZ568_33720 [Streptomyces olindensis]|uniref:Uncharacterized protein n=1 Tax=Streptomyces olindensis TaxID=358823 RepID=A0ABV2Y4W9_9ACTN
MLSRLPGIARRAALALTAGALASTALPATAAERAPGSDPLARYHQQRLTTGRLPARDVDCAARARG